MRDLGPAPLVYSPRISWWAGCAPAHSAYADPHYRPHESESMAQELDELGSLREHLLHRWVTWGIAPLVACAVITLLLASFAPVGPIEGKQAIRLAFEIVLGVGAAVFLAGFYIDGHWTDADRVARKIYAAAGAMSTIARLLGAGAAHRSALQSNAAIALASIRASADAITLMGAAIDLTAVVSVLMGLPTVRRSDAGAGAVLPALCILAPPYTSSWLRRRCGELLPREDAKATRAREDPQRDRGSSAVTYHPHGRRAMRYRRPKGPRTSSPTSRRAGGR